MRRRHLLLGMFLLLTAGGLVVYSLLTESRLSSGDWPFAGHDLHNTRAQMGETKISPADAAELAPKWVFTTGGDVSATPTVDSNAIYVPDWAGNLFKIDLSTGGLVWSHRISDYNGIPGSLSRTSPAVYGDEIIIGDQPANFTLAHAGAHVIAVNKHAAGLIWITEVEKHPAALITQSPVAYRGRVYVGVSSNEEALAENASYQCCSFRGSVVALDAATGQILWKTYTVPEGYSGGAVWGGTPVVDAKRNSLYVASGNNYNVPSSVAACEKSGFSKCLAADDYMDSVIALDLTTGAVKWGTRVQGFDAWTFACTGLPPGVTWCPSPEGPDYDFGAGASLFTVNVNGEARDLLGAGQKSGVYWALDPETGRVVWQTLVGPGGALGGIMWGSATDGRRIYVPVSNSDHKQYTLVPSGQNTTGGSWSALDAATGEILWQTPDPAGAVDTGPVTAANNVVYAGSMDPAGHMYALDATTGKILWNFTSGGSVNSGPAIVDGVVIWGSGYARFGTGNDRLYAFEVKQP